MTTLINQNEINGIIWKSCDTFRGTVVASDYKDYVLTMLFLKYISYVWQDHYEVYDKRYGDAPELIRELMATERFVSELEANIDTMNMLHTNVHALVV